MTLGDALALRRRFGGLTVGGDLWLYRNKLTSLPPKLSKEFLGKLKGVDELVKAYF